MQQYHIAHISTGDLLRAEVAAGTSLGKQAKKIMEAGHLLSDDIMLSMIEHRLNSEDTKQGFLLDGFPRTLPQAEALDNLLVRLGQPLDVVLFFDVDYGEIMTRLLARKRADDTEETIRKRLEVFEAQTAPLIDYYKNWEKSGDSEAPQYIPIEGVGKVEEIKDQIFSRLENL